VDSQTTEHIQVPAVCCDITQPRHRKQQLSPRQLLGQSASGTTARRTNSPSSQAMTTIKSCPIL